MVNLEIPRLKVPAADAASGPVHFHERHFEPLRKALPTAHSAGGNLARVAKPISPDGPAIGAPDAEGFERNALLSHVAGGSWRMVVPVLLLQLLRRNEAVLQNVFDDGSCTLVRNLAFRLI